MWSRMKSEVSVVIPTYNRKNYLIEAVRSVLSQTIPPAEIIVVDNGSTDGTLDLQFDDRVMVTKEEKRGAGFARNRGLEISTGKYLIFLDSDDLLSPSALETLLTQITTSDSGICFGRMSNFYQRDSKKKDKSYLYPLASNTMIRKDVFQFAGEFEGSNYSFPNWILGCKSIGITESSVDSIVSYRRIHDSNLSTLEESKQYYLGLARSRIENRSK